jgi:hypothetical protein
MKIIFVLAGTDYVRNYLRTGVVEALSTVHNVSVVADAKSKLREEIESHPQFDGLYTNDPWNKRVHTVLWRLYMWRFRSRSPTFYYRWQGMAKWSLLLPTRGIKQRLKNLREWAAHVTTRAKVWQAPILGNRLIFPLSSRIFRGLLNTPDSMKTLVNRLKPDLIVCPTSAYESAVIDLILLGKNLGVKTLCLVDNWDNLTSKTIFWAKPDFLGVWGPQIKEQAVRIHGFDEHQVFEIGSPRFETYFAPTSKTVAQPTPAPYILFVGSAMPFDELTALQRLESELESNGYTPDSIRIIYRPHPWQQPRRCEARFDSSRFRYASLDPQIAELFGDSRWPGEEHRRLQPDLDYYPQLLRGAKMVVGPLTTMLLEAALCLRPVIGLGYGDGLHFNTARRYFTHFDDTQRIPGFFLCENPDGLGSLVSTALNFPTISQEESDRATGHFVVPSRSDSYVDRLLNSINRLHAEPHHAVRLDT